MTTAPQSYVQSELSPVALRHLGTLKDAALALLVHGHGGEFDVDPANLAWAADTVVLQIEVSPVGVVTFRAVLKQ